MWPVKGNLGNTREDICCKVICLMFLKISNDGGQKLGV